MTAISESSSINPEFAAFNRDGFTVLPGVFSPAECREFAEEIDAAFAAASDSVLRTANAIFGARNFLDIWPRAATVWRKPSVVEFVQLVLGPDAGIVRALYFDKPPEQSWTLPFHRDKTIAVREHRADALRYPHPTVKAGVPHVEAPEWLLEQMLTLRIHLDPMTADNGPLSLIPGSHHRGASCERANDEASSRLAPPITPLGPAGDVLAMRPLVSHGSRHTTPGCQLRRRIVHLEFSGVRELTKGMAWHTFIPVG